MGRPKDKGQGHSKRYRSSIVDTELIIAGRG